MPLAAERDIVGLPMELAAEALKALLKLFLLALGVWKLFQLSDWLARRGGGDKIRRSRTKPRDDLDRNAPINPR